MIAGLLLGISRPCEQLQVRREGRFWVNSGSCDSKTLRKYDMVYEFLDIKYSRLRDSIKNPSGEVAETPTNPSVVYLDLFSDFLEDQ